MPKPLVLKLTPTQAVVVEEALAVYLADMGSTRSTPQKMVEAGRKVQGKVADWLREKGWE